MSAWLNHFVEFWMLCWREFLCPCAISELKLSEIKHTSDDPQLQISSKEETLPDKYYSVFLILHALICKQP
jgi:hypothetical protein